MQAIVIAKDPNERDLLVFAFRQVGLAVAASGDFTRVLANWTEHPADLILLSLQEEDKEPLKVLASVRNATQVPLILLLERVSERLTCELLEGGADIVLQRPASPRVIAAVGRALLRRANAIPAFVLPQLDLGEIAVDPSTRMVQVQGKEPQRLTQLEFRLLYVLMTNRGQVLPPEVIVERVWGYTGEGNRELVRGLVSRLRHKIEVDPERPRFLETLPGVGYRFQIETI